MNICRFPKLSRYFKGWMPFSQFLILLVVAGCTATTSFSDKNLKGFVGAPDEATRKAGQDILLKGGNAADAMAAMILNETVVTPSRAGLSGGGLCQVYDAHTGKVKTLDFLPVQIPQTKAGLPALPRGVFALHSQYGVGRWSDVVAPALQNAKNGVTVSDLLAGDIQQANKIPASWKTLKKGTKLVQPELAQTLSMMSQSGTGVFYKGNWANQMASAAFNLGYPYTTETLKTVRPQWTVSTSVATPKGKTFFPNTTTLTGTDVQIWKQLTSLNDFTQITKANEAMASLESKSFSAAFDGVGLLVTDKDGLTIACSIGMGGLFGDGMYLKEQGFFLANGLSDEYADHVFSVMQTNPDETDVTFVMAGAEEKALVNGLSLTQKMTVSQKSVAAAFKSVQETSRMPAVLCRGGYPNQVADCEINAFVQPVYDTVKSEK